MSMGTAPRVSVLLPVGRGGSLSSAESCLVDQADTALELILLHDGSEPDRLAHLAGPGDGRVRPLAHPPQGVARALGLGVAVARGRWLVSLTSGEALAPGALARQLECVAESPGALGVLARGESREPAGLLEALFADAPPLGGCALVRTDAVRAVGGYDPSLRFAHHLDLWFRLLGRGALVRSERVALGETSAERGPRECEPDATRVERVQALAHALGTCRADELVREARDQGEAELRVARAAARTGLPELRSEAVRRVFEARAAGASIDVASDATLAPLLAWAPALGRREAAAKPVREGESQVASGLRVALEVESLDRGGLESVVADLALGLASAGVAPLVVCTARGGVRAAGLRAAGVEVAVLRSADRAGELRDLLVDRGVDLLNPHFSTLGTPVAAGLGIPVVPTLHNAYAWVGASVLDELRAVDPLVAGYTAVSGFVADFSSARFGIARDRITVIPNAYRAGGAGRTLDRATARRELGLGKEVELVLQVGRLDPVKCPLAVVDAVEALSQLRPQLRAWIAGAVGDAGYVARVEERIERGGARDRVALLGERDDVDRLLAAADVFVMPSVVEGLSLSVIEALAAGVPAILTRTGDAARLLGETTSGSAVPGALIDGPAIDPVRIEGEELFRLAAVDHPPHAPALADAIVRVLDDLPAMRERARERGAALSRDFAPAAILGRYAAVFERAVAGHSRARARAVRRETAGAIGRLHVAAETREAARAALAGASQGLEATLGLERERRQAVSQVGPLSWEVGQLRAGLDETAGVVDQVLDKLRLTHRLRGALASLRRRLVG